MERWGGLGRGTEVTGKSQRSGGRDSRKQEGQGNWGRRQPWVEAGTERAAGVAKDKFPTLQFPCESTILLNRIMDFKKPRKAESAVRWAALLLLTTTFFLELREEINQTTRAASESLGSTHRHEVNTYTL